MAVLGRWQLPPLQLDLIRRYLRLDDLSLPLDTRSFGGTLEELQQLGRAEYPRMQASGVLVGDEVPPQLASALQVLVTPYLWVDSLWFPRAGDDHSWRTVAALTEGDQVVLGVQAPSENPRYGGLLTLEIHDKVPLPQVVLPTLPPAPPGNQGTARVPESSVRRDQNEEEQGSLMQEFRPSRSSSGDRQVQLYSAIGKAEHTRIGQLAANQRDRHGRVKRSHVVRWFDNVEPDGRYLDLVERGSTGESVYVLAAADARAIGAQIDALVASVLRM